mgnify:CR=1 FL=1
MKKMDGISRTRVKALLANRVVLVDNNIQTQYNFPLKPGMRVQVSREKNKHEFRHPMLKILYEDAYLIVVEKKEGLLSVATDHQKERTAQHILNEYVKRTHRNNRIFVVHRLDRETSGIMMYAKDEKTQHTLRDNWHDIVYDRRYVSIVMGDMEKDQGTVRSWLTDRKLYVSSSPVDDGEAFHHALPHHQAGQWLFAHGAATGNGTQEPDSRAHAVARSSGGGRCTLRLRNRPARTSGTPCLQAVLLPPAYGRTDGIRDSLSCPVQEPDAEKIKTIYDKKPDF